MIDFTKPVQTLDGRKARILCTDRKSETDTRHIVAAVAITEDHEGIYTYDPRGLEHGLGSLSAADLVNVPEETVRYLVQFHKDYGFKTAEEAARQARLLNGSLGCIKVTIVDGKVTKAEVL